MRQLTDDQLVSQLRLGHSEALAEVYARFQGRIHRFCLKLLGDESQADDVVQEVFLKARKSISMLREGPSLRPWLLSIARNEVYMQLRRERRNGVLRDEEVWTDEVHEDMVRGETVEIVQQMIALLKPEYREVLVLREYEQLSYAEIAGVTGDTESSVKSRLFKARKALFQKLKPYFR